MYIKAPRFWWKRKSFLRFLLAPIASIYGCYVRYRMIKTPPIVDLPVLCIGNFTLGGTGKTPVVIAFSQLARELGLNPGIVSRGYGGIVKGVHLVDVKRDNADHVGDEALLLAHHALVAISPDRYIAAQRLKREGCDFILMDDGFQSRRLYMDYALLVVDAMRGFGNGAVFPAGPLRAPLDVQFSFMDSILCIGHLSECDNIASLAVLSDKSLHYACFKSLVSSEVTGKSFLAFSGIGNPDKFFRSIEEMSGHVVQKVSYPDHYVFTVSDIKSLVQKAQIQNLWLATTAKDYVRMQAQGLQRNLKNLIVFDVKMDFFQKDFCHEILEEVMTRFRQRKRPCSM
ncbi:tetraacyldisaccharide 4'-kinase [Bartonella ancashensis]|uniref:Tetraacyldisaccharide 4'-kinase n=1 Tax=Bartonella ancashensis TaxID=1318743 RepID=A0A0M4L6U0_9HYPH|nr:tetraacyldisaccharide 4'-kinase [Bartonella ancashensis]ALE03470.1 Tetraacyldisaccharide 4'-kinase [Bartonella ancashensis]